MKKNLSILAAVLAVACGLVICGCGQRVEKFGDAPEESAPKTAISSILLNPQEYMDKEVVIAGTIVVECPAGCFFHLRDGSGSIYVELKGNSFVPIPQRTGRTAVVKGTVYEGAGERKETRIFAKGLLIK